MLSINRLRSICTIALAALALPGAALGQAYPSKPVRMVVAFPAGSATDSYMRLIAERAQPRLGQNIVIENRAGAGGLVGAQHVRAQPPDGYVLLNVSPQMAVRTAAPKPPFDVRKDFTAIIQLTETPFFLAVNVEKVPARSVRELIDLARAKPGQLNFSSYGTGALGHLSVELFAQMNGIKMVHVPFNGSAANSMALSRGDGHVTFDVLSSLRPHVESGRVRLLAVASQERSPFVPDLPGMREAGLPGFDVASASGLSAPAGASREIVDRLNAAFNAAIKEPDLVDRLARMGFGLVGGTPEQFSAMLERSVTTWSRVIREGNITLE